jgi:hypothetical protein
MGADMNPLLTQNFVFLDLVVSSGTIDDAEEMPAMLQEKLRHAVEEIDRACGELLDAINAIGRVLEA